MNQGTNNHQTHNPVSNLLKAFSGGSPCDDSYFELIFKEKAEVIQSALYSERLVGRLLNNVSTTSGGSFSIIPDVVALGISGPGAETFHLQILASPDTWQNSRSLLRQWCNEAITSHQIRIIPAYFDYTSGVFEYDVNWTRPSNAPQFDKVPPFKSFRKSGSS